MVSKTIKRTSRKVGLPPGSLVHIGEQKIERTRIKIMDYDQEHVREREVATIEECFPFKEEPSTTWINIDGLHEVDVIEKIGNHFGIHPLILEDIVNTGQRPKMEDFGEYVYITLRMLYLENESRDIHDEQVSIILGNNFVISFQERVGDVFEPVRERIRSGKIRVKNRKADHIAYALIDGIVDNYFIILEKLGERIEALEEDLLRGPSADIPRTLHDLKRKMISLRKSVWPLRELISGLERADSPLILETTSLYLKDVYDHTIQVIDTIESYRDMTSGMLDTYLTNVSNRMNEVMKVLTIIATIFIPLTFFAGIYGMNFEHMPELGWRWIYPLGFWIAIAVIAGSMLLFFKRKKWL